MTAKRQLSEPLEEGNKLGDGGAIGGMAAGIRSGSFPHNTRGGAGSGDGQSNSNGGEPSPARNAALEKVIQAGPSNSADVGGDPSPDTTATSKDQSLPLTTGPELNQDDTAVELDNRPEGSPAKSSPGESIQDPFNKSDIESLYASPSPEKMITELDPIELDSDPDFEMMERMLLSHRGPSSQPQTTQSPVLSGTNRPLKRQWSHPSLIGSSQVPTQTPQLDSKRTKRPRLNGPHSFDSATVLNDRKKHPEFWELDGTVILQVDDILFRVMRSTLSKASPWFQRLFSEEHDHLEIMAGCPVYVIEEDFSHLDFENLLRGLENGL